MKIHEYHAKAILARYGFRAAGEVVFAAADADVAAKRWWRNRRRRARFTRGPRGRGGVKVVRGQI